MDIVVRDHRKNPRKLPPDHPFAGTRIIFGVKRPTFLKKDSEKTQQQESVQLQNDPQERLNVETEPVEDDPPACPYCSATDDCPHLLLMVDKTFRTANGGLLMEVFNKLWYECCDKGGDDMDESEVFEELLSSVSLLSDAISEGDFEGGPGMSSDYEYYFVESYDNAEKALDSFKEIDGI